MKKGSTYDPLRSAWREHVIDPLQEQIAKSSTVQQDYTSYQLVARPGKFTVKSGKIKARVYRSVLAKAGLFVSNTGRAEFVISMRESVENELFWKLAESLETDSAGTKWAKILTERFEEKK
jgi:hypothetical protein